MAGGGTDGMDGMVGTVGGGVGAGEGADVEGEWMFGRGRGEVMLMFGDSARSWLSQARAWSERRVFALRLVRETTPCTIWSTLLMFDAVDWSPGRG